MKIIQIRGCNGTGKSTIVREFINRNGYEIISVPVGRRNIQCCKVDGIIIIGLYDTDCGGCDKYTNDAEELKNTIAVICKNLKPEVLLFESLICGVTFKFSKDIFTYSKIIHADFLAICLEPKFEVALNRVYEHNSGKEIDIKKLETKYKSCLRGNVKLRLSNIPTKTYDTGKMTIEEMGRVIDDAIKK